MLVVLCENERGAEHESEELRTHGELEERKGEGEGGKECGWWWVRGERRGKEEKVGSRRSRSGRKEE